MTLTCIAKEPTAKRLKKRTIQVAQQFYKYGNVDRGRAIFEDMLTKNLSTEVVWKVFLDMELGIGNVNVIRRLFERVVASNPPTKPMKPILTGFLVLEEKTVMFNQKARKNTP